MTWAWSKIIHPSEPASSFLPSTWSCWPAWNMQLERGCDLITLPPDQPVMSHGPWLSASKWITDPVRQAGTVCMSPRLNQLLEIQFSQRAGYVHAFPQAVPPACREKPLRCSGTAWGIMGLGATGFTGIVWEIMISSYCTSFSCTVCSSRLFIKWTIFPETNCRII